MIDMQRDFLEPGGFGAALGNDVSRLAPCRRAGQAPHRSASAAPACRSIHTRECHRPDLSDCPPAKRARGGARAAHRRSRPDGPHPDRGRAGRGNHSASSHPRPGEFVDRQAGQGRLLRDAARQDLVRERGITHLVVGGVTTEVCVQTTMREANDRGYECLLAEDATASYFPEFKQAALGDGARTGRHRRLDRSSRGHPGGDQLIIRDLLTNPSALRFEPFREGIEAAWLHRDPDGGPAAAVLRYQPGAQGAAPSPRGLGAGDPDQRQPGRRARAAQGGRRRAQRARHRARSRQRGGLPRLLVWERQPIMLE